MDKQNNTEFLMDGDDDSLCCLRSNADEVCAQCVTVLYLIQGYFLTWKLMMTLGPFEKRIISKNVFKGHPGLSTLLQAICVFSLSNQLSNFSKTTEECRAMKNNSMSFMDIF